MSFKTIANVVTSKVGRQALKLQKHSPVLLFTAGAIGVVAATVIACRATLKLDDILAEADVDLEKARGLEHPKYSEQDRQLDIAKIYGRTTYKVARLYGPAIIVGGLSIAALTGSHVVLNRRYLGVTAAYAALDKGFREYRQRVVDKLGLDTDREFRYDMEDRTIVEETKTGPKTKTIKQIGPKGASIYARMFDECSGYWDKRPTYNSTFLMCQQNYANDLLNSQGHIFLNEVYDMLDIPRSREGSVVGWIKNNGDDHVDFGVFEGDRHSGMRFVLGHEPSVMLDFNVDGIIWDKI